MVQQLQQQIPSLHDQVAFDGDAATLQEACHQQQTVPVLEPVSAVLNSLGTAGAEQQLISKMVRLGSGAEDEVLSSAIA